MTVIAALYQLDEYLDSKVAQPRKSVVRTGRRKDVHPES